VISAIGHKLIWSWRRRRVLGIALLAVILNLLAINTFDAPSHATSGLQYQSYYWSAVSASSFTSGHPPLTAAIDGNPIRFETITKDDLGYPLVLSTVVRLGIIDFDDDTRTRLVTGFPNIEANREYMFEDLRLKTQNLNRGMPMLLGLGVLAAMWSGLIPAAARAFARSWGLIVFATLQLLPHMAPSIVLKTLHSHGLVFSAWIVGMMAVAGVFAAAAAFANRTNESLISLRWYFALGLLAGWSFGFVETIRRSTGLIFSLVTWLTLGLIAVSLLRGQRDRTVIERLRAVLPLALLGAALLMGMFAFDGFISFILDYRDTRTAFPRPPIASIGHPIYFTLLVAIGFQENSLGVRGEAEVVALIKSSAPGDPAQDSQAFIDEARRVFFSYASDHPSELVQVAYANFGQTARSSFTELGVTFDPNVDFVPLFLILLGLMALIRLAFIELRTTDETFATSFVSQLLVGSAIALGGASLMAGITTTPAEFDLVSAIVFACCTLLAMRLRSVVAGAVPLDETTAFLTPTSNDLVTDEVPARSIRSGQQGNAGDADE